MLRILLVSMSVFPAFCSGSLFSRLRGNKPRIDVSGDAAISGAGEEKEDEGDVSRSVVIEGGETIVETNLDGNTRRNPFCFGNKSRSMKKIQRNECLRANLDLVGNPNTDLGGDSPYGRVFLLHEQTDEFVSYLSAFSKRYGKKSSFYLKNLENPLKNLRIPEAGKHVPQEYIVLAKYAFDKSKNSRYIWPCPYGISEEVYVDNARIKFDAVLCYEQDGEMIISREMDPFCVMQPSEELKSNRLLTLRYPTLEIPIFSNTLIPFEYEILGRYAVLKSSKWYNVDRYLSWLFDDISEAGFVALASNKFAISQASSDEEIIEEVRFPPVVVHSDVSGLLMLDNGDTLVHSSDANTNLGQPPLPVVHTISSSTRDAEEPSDETADPWSHGHDPHTSGTDALVISKKAKSSHTRQTSHKRTFGSNLIGISAPKDLSEMFGYPPINAVKKINKGKKHRRKNRK